MVLTGCEQTDVSVLLCLTIRGARKISSSAQCLRLRVCAGEYNLQPQRSLGAGPAVQQQPRHLDMAVYRRHDEARDAGLRQ
jgi:hypothetical protein